jgi:hypothetical protein
VPTWKTIWRTYWHETGWGCRDDIQQIANNQVSVGFQTIRLHYRIWLWKLNPIELKAAIQGLIENASTP